MHRRAVLRAGLGVAALGATGSLRTRAGPVESSTGGESGRDYGPVDRVLLHGTADCRVAPDGETAFVAVGDGFVAVALSGMVQLAEIRAIEVDRDSGPLTGVADLAIDGDQLLVPGPSNPRPGQLAGFAVFDVADPSSPEQVAFYETGFAVHNAALAGGRAYLTAGRSLVVVDVTADDPVEVGRWSLADADPRWDDVHPALRVLHDVRVRGDLAVLSQWDAGTWLVDVGSMDDVAVVGRVGGRSPAELAAVPDDAVRREAVQLPGNHHSAALSADGSLLAVGAEAFDAEADDGEGGPGGIDLYDAADPSSPAHLATIDAPRAADETPAGTWTTAHDFAFDGDRLLSAWYQGGVRIHDVSDPAVPVELAWWRQPAEMAFWTARPAVDDTFVASATTLPGGDLESGLFLFQNRAGQQADPPSLTDPPPPTATPSPTPTPTASPTPRPTPTQSPTSTTRATRTLGQPGFGPAGALGAVAGLAAFRRWRR